MKPSILITGGAGYIGSHTAYLMSQSGYNIIILDTLNHKQSFDHNWATLIKSDFADTKVLKNIFSNYNIKAVMHFAAFIEVGESVKNPLQFYENNVVKTVQLLKVMLEHNVKNFIFSSSCAVYGSPQYLPLTEQHTKNPISPYGKNKLMVEMALEDFNIAYGLNYVNLRYFNAAGAMPQYGLGENHDPETHLIPLVLRAAMENKEFCIFGDNYETKDGSCIRDYVHVWDIAQAHKLALEYLQAGNTSDSFNLGTGEGFSVKEIVMAVEQICCAKINIALKNKRPGDPAILVADPKKASDILGWSTQYSNLDFIIRTAYENENTKNFIQNKSSTQKDKEKSHNYNKI
ncbi:MAG: ExoB [candidate division TM6 bacterium GW2011_GWF2_30_66]|jgi:UDP-glucose 4-epimerase|nr:MAG: ExoB [candidate division TM6 bacterium GW2011_GWF2_30_66]